MCGEEGNKTDERTEILTSAHVCRIHFRFYLSIFCIIYYITYILSICFLFERGETGSKKNLFEKIRIFAAFCFFQSDVHRICSLIQAHIQTTMYPTRKGLFFKSKREEKNISGCTKIVYVPNEYAHTHEYISY